MDEREKELCSLSDERKETSTDTEFSVDEDQATKKDYTLLHLSHIGKILSNYTLLGAIFVMSSIFVFALTFLYYIVLTILTVGSLGILFFIPGFSAAWSGGEIIFQISAAVSAIGIYSSPVVAVLGIFSIIFMCIDKKNIPKGRLIVTSVFIGLTIVAALYTFIFTGLGGSVS